MKIKKYSSIEFEEKIKKILRETIKEILKVHLDDDEYLMKAEIAPEEFLYVVVRLEDEYHLPISKILRWNTYKVLSINKLSAECVKQLGMTREREDFYGKD